MMQNIAQLLSEHAQTFSQFEAVVDLRQKTRFTYQEYNQRVNQLVHWLKSQKIQKGD